MQIYFAPLEGITGYVFRNAYNKYYGGVDKYFTPFITPHTKKLMNSREKRDILPENNSGLVVVPQVLTNKAEELIDVCKRLEEFGYHEVNLNLGCPSKTVTSKRKGSGFLENPSELEELFDRFFKVSDTKLSIKTRIGISELEEAERLFRVFERFPFEEVIIHARLQQEFYQGTPHYDVFEDYCKRTKHSLCYNGDLKNWDDIDTLEKQFEKCDKFMLGRGLLFHPAALLSREDKRIDKVQEMEKFKGFHDELVEGYDAYMCGDRNTLFKMKELWGYWGVQFPGQDKILKKIKKADTLAEYRPLVNSIISSVIE
ncbi:MAG: tRNA-dihydrouridine synthase family protein [Lachnospiraceae bacterium]|nr:tRNA-dihydrouridine synthase family protein [Lachnospiraceae bacterium]